MDRTLRFKVLCATGTLAVTLFSVAMVSVGGVGLTGPAPSINSFTVDGGGGTSTSGGGSFALSGTIGQPDAASGGPLSGGTFAVIGGFWPGTITPAPVCAADITGNDVVNIDDLLAVINAWGACPAPPMPCLADIAPSGSGGNGVVDIDDLLTVINGWGACP
jgi:hypothetical protein